MLSIKLGSNHFRKIHQSLFNIVVGFLMPQINPLPINKYFSLYGYLKIIIHKEKKIASYNYPQELQARENHTSSTSFLILKTNPKALQTMEVKRLFHE